MSTLFTRIIAQEIPSYKIYEDEYVYAFLDISPLKLGHTLIVPKIEVDHFSDIPEPYYSALFRVAKLLSKAIEKATGCKRICTMFVWYEIPHAHYHLIPTDDIYDLDPSHAKKGDPKDLQNMQEKILEQLINS